MKNRYYVQPLTRQVFIIRERIATAKGPGPNDRVVRSFSIRHDAYSYAREMNNSIATAQAVLTLEPEAVVQSV